MKTTTKLFLIITITTLVGLFLGIREPARAKFNHKLPEKSGFSLEQSNNIAKTITFNPEEYSINKILNFEFHKNKIITNFLLLKFSILVTLFMLEILLILEEELFNSWE